MKPSDLSLVANKLPLSESVRRINSQLEGKEAARNPMVSPPVEVNFKPRPSKDELKLNKLEKRRLEYLRMLRVPCLGIQNLTFKLADDTRLTPDFSFIDENGRLTLDDVKGFQREDALIKMKVAARQFPWARWIISKWVSDHWEVREVEP